MLPLACDWLYRDCLFMGRQGKGIVIETEESKKIKRKEEDLNGVNPFYAILGAGGAAAMSFGSWKVMSISSSLSRARSRLPHLHPRCARNTSLREVRLTVCVGIRLIDWQILGSVQPRLHDCTTLSRHALLLSPYMRIGHALVC